VRIPASQQLVDICEYFNRFLYTGYSRARLVLATHDYLVSQDAKDCYLQAFFQCVGRQLGGNELIDYEKLKPKFKEFANYWEMILHSSRGPRLEGNPFGCCRR